MRILAPSLFGALTALGAAQAPPLPEDEATYYCNSAMMWDAPPPRQGDSGAQLTRVVVFGRHGSRAPVFTLPCWPGDETSYTCKTESSFGFVNSRFGGQSPSFKRIRDKRGVLAGASCLEGQLTEPGVQMLLDSGIRLRETYGAALGLADIPEEPEVMFRSTDVPRVYESAGALAWGMFPELSNDDPFDVMSIIVADKRSDTMIPSATVCPGLDDALDEFYESSEAEERAELRFSVRESIGEITGYTPLFRTNDTKQMWKLYTFPGVRRLPFLV
ncbi:hypothetical protein FOZ62_016653 [Perkinsus olseni]|uniref:Lysophosphatidic acid phosphatase type 6 n=1 Tax=Perkinsus olseni TaxID=32597 RepID=A0A7J6UCS3_PEROL|nr:hypothetical protein FOZ62_016653 [Perkinsus olseni]